MRFLCLVWLVCGPANAVVPGDCSIIENPSLTGVANHASARADGDSWFAVERLDTNLESVLGLRWYSGGVFQENRIMTTLGDLSANHAMYSPAMTWSGAAKVSVMMKEDGSGTTAAQLQVLSIDRDNIEAGTITAQELVPVDDNDHGRPDMAWNAVTELRHACWTRNDPNDVNNDDDDVMAKIRTEATWSDSDLEQVSNIADPVLDEHCQIGFMHEGTRAIVYARSDVGIKVALDEGASIDKVELPNADVADNWPSISTAPGASATDVWVVARDQNNDLRTWHCDGATGEPDCDATNDWTDEGTFDPGGGVLITDPHLVTVTVSSEVHHRFVLYEDTSAQLVRLLKWCEGNGDWTDAGPLPRTNTNYDDSPSEYIGPVPAPGSTMDAFLVEGTMLHATYIAQRDGESGLTSYDAMHWKVDATDTDLCP